MGLTIDAGILIYGWVVRVGLCGSGNANGETMARKTLSSLYMFLAVQLAHAVLWAETVGSTR